MTRAFLEILTRLVVPESLVAGGFIQYHEGIRCHLRIGRRGRNYGQIVHL